MRIRRLRHAVVVLSLAVGTVALGAPPASAQSTRTWVSGVGDDANPCTRTAPCKTFVGAMVKTATGGVINALDDGGYGGVTIDRAITIDGGGHVASALVAGGVNAIVVNAPVDAQVVLRNIDIKATNPAEGSCGGLNGVRIIGAASVRLDNVSIGGFDRAVSAPLTNSSPDTFVDISINDSRIADNCQHGIQLAPAAGHHGRLALDNTTITGSNVALSVAAGGEAWVSNTRIYLNNLGVEPAGGRIHSYCNNQVAGNASDGAFSDDLCGGAQPPQPAPAATKYCTVPKLKSKSESQAAQSLSAAGCSLGKVKKRTGPARKKGKVVSQDVVAGTEVKLGTKVGVVVGK